VTRHQADRQPAVASRGLCTRVRTFAGGIGGDTNQSSIEGQGSRCAKPAVKRRCSVLVRRSIWRGRGAGLLTSPSASSLRETGRESKPVVQ